MKATEAHEKAVLSVLIPTVRKTIPRMRKMRDIRCLLIFICESLLFLSDFFIRAWVVEQ